MAGERKALVSGKLLRTCHGGRGGTTGAHARAITRRCISRRSRNRARPFSKAELSLLFLRGLFIAVMQNGDEVGGI